MAIYFQVTQTIYRHVTTTYCYLNQVGVNKRLTDCLTLVLGGCSH